MMPTVDIIIPAYNAAKFLPAALDSVEAQSFKDWRILLVDDGSTDHTEELVAPYCARLGDKLKYIRQPNRGLPAARNAAIANSSAEFLALLDADDVWLPWRLEESLKAFLGRPKVGLAYGLITQIDPEGRLLGTFLGNASHAEGKIAPYIYMRKVEFPCPTVTFRSECVAKVGGFDETMRASEDRDLWLRIALQYEVACVPRVIAYYRVSPNSMSTDPERMVISQRQFIRKHFGAKGCGVRARQIALARVYKQRAEAFVLCRQTGKALKSAVRALATYPFDVDNVRTAGSLLLRFLGIRI